ncbi:MAG: DNA mismatch endonuclease Vsr [Flavobacteriales bacterium]|nr:DNA mismatch endonuclease Vsr [Flavobacteriales bacterium]
MPYLRDGRAPVPTDERVSATMSRIRAKNTKPELLARQHLRSAGFTGYRLHYTKVPGRPDIAFVGRRLAVFVHGCFWHGCPHCRPRTPKSNSAFWVNKVATNQARDKRKVAELKKAGWRVFTVWECRLRSRPERELGRVLRALAG